MSQALAELLARDRIITPVQFQEAVAASKQGKDHVRYLIEKKHVSETKLLYYLSQKFGLPSVNIAKFEVPADVARILGPDQVKKFQAIPIQANATTLVVAVADPTRMTAIEDLKFQVKRTVEVVLTSFSAFDSVAEKYTGGSGMVGQAIEDFQKSAPRPGKPGAPGAEPESEFSAADLEIVQVHEIDPSKASEAPVISLVNGLLVETIKRMASDLHVEPYEKRFRVRMRIDGSLHETAQIPVEMKRAVIARLKIMSRMDIAESRIPQDGRIKLKLGGNEIDFRVNTIPTMFGEKVVLRQLNKSNLSVTMDKLGFDEHQFKVFKKGIYSPNGLVLVTGPTGSGKTTTLYTAINELNQISDNLSTAEDPVEYSLEGVNQVQVNKDVGLTFAAVLRALLRQDPDAILVGEIRDYETAEVAIQAALTGHLVLSTLHTNDAPSTIIRLTNMGVEPFLVAASVNTIVAQRLIRSVCPGCKAPRQVPRERLNAIGFTPEMIARMNLVEGRGCEACGKTGYKGRRAIFEVLEFTPTLKELVLRGESLGELRKRATEEGMTSLRASALRKAAEGLTTIEEALSVTTEN